MFSSFFGSPVSGTDLKTEIKKNLKTYQELRKEYNLTRHYGIYRSSSSAFFEKNGIPKVNQITYYGNQVSAPVFFSVDPKISHREGCQTQSDCITWQYNPKQNIDGRRLLFLDLTGDPLIYDHVEWVMKDSGLKKHILNNKLIRLIYDKIKETRGEQPPEILNAYGYYTGVRHSDLNNDRFFSLELFRLVKELNIETEAHCVFLGYFHGLVKQDYSGEEGDSRMFPFELTKKRALQSKSPEFSIPYEKVANLEPVYIKPLSIITITTGGKSRKKKKQNKRKTQKYKTYKKKTKRIY